MIHTIRENIACDSIKIIVKISLFEVEIHWNSRDISNPRFLNFCRDTSLLHMNVCMTRMQSRFITTRTYFSIAERMRRLHRRRSREKRSLTCYSRMLRHSTVSLIKNLTRTIPPTAMERISNVTSRSSGR